MRLGCLRCAMVSSFAKSVVRSFGCRNVQSHECWRAGSGHFGGMAEINLFAAREHGHPKPGARCPIRPAVLAFRAGPPRPSKDRWGNSAGAGGSAAAQSFEGGCDHPPPPASASQAIASGYSSRTFTSMRPGFLAGSARRRSPIKRPIGAER
jgi:hypothetical protein